MLYVCRLEYMCGVVQYGVLTELAYLKQLPKILHAVIQSKQDGIILPQMPSHLLFCGVRLSALSDLMILCHVLGT